MKHLERRPEEVESRAMEMTSDHENQDFAIDSGKVKTLLK